MPVILVLLAAVFLAKFGWLLAAFGEAAAVGRLIGGWLAQRRPPASSSVGATPTSRRGLTGSTPRYWPAQPECVEAGSSPLN